MRVQVPALCCVLVFMVSGCKGSGVKPNQSTNINHLSKDAALSILRDNVDDLGWHSYTCALHLDFKPGAVRTNQGYQEFYRELVDTGVLKGQDAFEAVKQADTEVDKSDKDEGAVEIFTLTRLSFDEVTELTEDGPTATVLVKTSYVPTKVGKIINKAYHDAHQKYPHMSNPLSCGVPLMEQAAAGGDEVLRFRFVRYDNKWQLQF